jgi:hypothetical protein
LSLFNLPPIGKKKSSNNWGWLSVLRYMVGSLQVHDF